jgi:hypothetical protein
MQQRMTAQECRLLALSGRGRAADPCPLSGVKRTFPLSALGALDSEGAYREANVMLPINQIATAATSPALANAPDTTAALKRITPSA